MLRSYLIGLAAGQRGIVPLAALAAAGRRGALPDDMPLVKLFKNPLIAWGAVAFSAGTRNSLVVLPLALVVPGAIPLVPAIIVTQTLIELLAELAYIRIIPRLGRRAT